MAFALGARWDFHVRRRTMAGLMATLTCMALVATPATRGIPEEAGRLVSVIVRELPGTGTAAERAVRDAGGEVGRRIGIIGGFVAEVPEPAVERFSRLPGVHSVTPNRRVQMLHTVDGFDPVQDTGSMYVTTKITDARKLWARGITGRGVDVALVDTGVVPVQGLAGSGKVVNGPDLSFESQSDDLRYLDTFGHGTHIAGIIAGRDEGATIDEGDVDLNKDLGDHHAFMGVAPRARLVNVKVANAFGVTDVSQVLAAIDWVVQHRKDDGLNIRVLNLSFGTDGSQDYRLDPLAYAVEVAWRHGIVVVTAAGNAGGDSSKLNNPAYHPGVIAVGASDPNGTRNVRDDTVPHWSSRGDGNRNPDLVAPGKSMVSLRNPGSYIDDVHPEGNVNHRFFRGSGTSQAAATVSGAAALLLQQRPHLTPDQVKQLLVTTASPLPEVDARAQGAGSLDIWSASMAPAPEVTPMWEPATGTGSLHLARGSAIVADEDGEELVGEQDIFGTPWDGKTWSELAWEGKTWSGGDWLGKTWSGDCWCGSSWAGKTWSGKTWSGKTWSGKTWSTDNWTGKTWSGKTWSSDPWSGKTWSGKTWSGKTWSWDGWSGTTWSTASWG